jgi:nicotinamide-nucleotide adenylyltransferase
MTRGLYIGRFQPYHNGHQAVLERICREIDEIVIGIGSAQLSHEPENPFTAGERVLMITRAMEEIDCPNYVIPLEDIRRNSLWAAHVKAMSPPFDIVFSSNPLVIRLFGEAGITVRSPEMYERETHSGTEIRRRMLSGGRWRELVPPAVATVIDEIDGVQRLIEISGTD